MELLAVIVGLEKLKNQIQKYLLFLIPSMVDSILKKWVLVGRKILDRKMLIYGSAC
jgi:hypothetical protein